MHPLFRSRTAFWISLFALFLGVLWVLRPVLLPFVAALFLAYLLNPIANRLERLGLTRVVAALLILFAFVIVVAVTLVLLLPLLWNQALALLRTLPATVTELHAILLRWLRDLGDNPVARYLIERLGGSEQDVGTVMAQAAAWGGAFLSSLLYGGQALFSLLALLVLAPIVAFYILVDWPRMIAVIDGWLPVRQAATVRRLAREIDAVIAAFIRGQSSVCVALALFYGISLTATGLNFGLLIGVASGVLSFVPYLGSTIGFLVALVVAVVQFWPALTPVLLVVGIFVAGQIVDGYVLQPQLVGGSVGLHPVWLMFALFAFGSLLGFVGLMLAVPLAAAMGVLLRFAIERYRASPYYTGVLQPTDEPGA